MNKEWFSHDYGTRHKMKLSALIKEKKMRGYGLFWVIVEMLYETSDKWMDLDEVTYIAIEGQSGESATFVREFVDQCIGKYKVFHQDGNRFTTQRVLLNMDTRLAISQQKSESGKKGAEARWQKIAGANGEMASAIECHDGEMANDGKGKESKVKERRVKSYLRPKGLTASSEADPAEIKALKVEYDQLVESLSGKENVECWNGVKAFVAEKKPSFLEPYIDLWNIFALNHHLIKQPIRITDHRRKKLETRLREPGFDFISILSAVKKSNFLQGRNDREWTVDFEFIVHSEENYTKISEGKYK